MWPPPLVDATLLSSLAVQCEVSTLPVAMHLKFSMEAEPCTSTSRTCHEQLCQNLEIEASQAKIMVKLCFSFVLRQNIFLS